MNKKGQVFPYIVGGAIILLAAMVVLAFAGINIGGTDVTAKFTGGGDDGTVKTSGVPVESLTVLQTNKHTKATEGGDDVEFWDKDADIQDSSLSAREVLSLSSGTVTDTSVSALRSNYGPEDMDLYVEGAGNYYDEMVSAWEIEYNKETGKGVLTANGPSGSVVATDIGTFADIDTPEALDTGFADEGSGVVNYSIAGGDGSAYIRIEIGNDEVDSELRDTVLCVGDADGDLEGDELAGMTIALYTGNSVGSINSDLLSLFSDAAGTGSYACTSIGDIVDLKKGTYQIDMTITEANFEANEEFEIGLDDLGDWKTRQEPSGNLKASAEDLTIKRVS